jgi:ubiquitin-like protein Pup
MAVRKHKENDSKATEEVVEETAPVEQDREVLDVTDDLLDEIDSVLEENAEEFVKGYVQKGGQ